VRVELTEEQQQLRKVIEENLAIVKETNNGRVNESHDEVFRNMADAAHQLHMSLNPYPTHRSYMVQNSGMEPENPEFYAHVHTVEDLLSYLNDNSANDDPTDQTLDTAFYMNLFSRRWGHEDRYELIRNAEGWNVSHLTYNGQSGKDALEVLVPSLVHDSIAYPYDLGNVMIDIWNQAEEYGLSNEEVQNMLNEVAQWINASETNYPSFVR